MANKNQTVSKFCRAATAIAGRFEEKKGREAYQSIQEYLQRSGAISLHPGIVLRSFGGQNIDYSRVDFYHLVTQKDKSRLIVASVGLALLAKNVEYVRAEFTSPVSQGEEIAEMRDDLAIIMSSGTLEISSDVSINR